MACVCARARVCVCSVAVLVLTHTIPWSSQGETLFVASSNATADGNGVLHAIDTTTGLEKWNFTATDGPHTWGLRITPAVTEAYVLASRCSPPQRFFLRAHVA